MSLTNFLQSLINKFSGKRKLCLPTTEKRESQTKLFRRKRGVPTQIPLYYIPESVLQATNSFLSHQATIPAEGYLFWLGTFGPDGECQVVGCLIPKGDSRYGGVRIPTSKMAEIAEQVRKHDLFLVAQIHSHPGNFGHSKLDEQKAISARPGFVSIVVPNFGKEPLRDLRHCFIYEYVGQNEWRQLEMREIELRFIVEPTVLEV